MVKPYIAGIGLALLTLSRAALASEGYITQEVNGDACDERQTGDDARTAENRALDKAGLAAIKTSGLVQKRYPFLADSALNMVSYRLIDEYLYDVKHHLTLDDETRVCVSMQATLEIEPEDLEELVQEYKFGNEPTVAQIEKVAKQVQSETQFKPKNINEKKLIYIEPLHFWSGTKTDIYNDVLRQEFAGSEYFYVTTDKSMADYVIKPTVEKAAVDMVDNKNNKMQISVKIAVVAPNENDFQEIDERQSHFILFAADKDEQELADSLIRKLLKSTASAINNKLDNNISQKLEESRLYGK